MYFYGSTIPRSPWQCVSSHCFYLVFSIAEQNITNQTGNRDSPSGFVWKHTFFRRGWLLRWTTGLLDFSDHHRPDSHWPHKIAAEVHPIFAFIVIWLVRNHFAHGGRRRSSIARLSCTCQLRTLQGLAQESSLLAFTATLLVVNSWMFWLCMLSTCPALPLIVISLGFTRMDHQNHFGLRSGNDYLYSHVWTASSTAVHETFLKEGIFIVC
jgi:hypothetical protein